MELFQLFGKWLSQTMAIVKDNVQKSVLENITASQEQKIEMFQRKWHDWVDNKTESLIGTDIQIEGVTFVVESLFEESMSRKKKALGLALPSLIAVNNCSMDKYADSLNVMFRTPQALMYLTEDFSKGTQGCKYIQEAYKVVHNSIEQCSRSNNVIYKDTADLVGQTEKVIERFCSDASYRDSFNIPKECEEGVDCVEESSRSFVSGAMDCVFGAKMFGFGGPYLGAGLEGLEEKRAAELTEGQEQKPERVGGVCPVGGTCQVGNETYTVDSENVNLGGCPVGGTCKVGNETFTVGDIPTTCWKHHSRARDPQPPEMDDVCRATALCNNCLKKNATCGETNGDKKVDNELRDSLNSFCIKHKSWIGTQLNAAQVEAIEGNADKGKPTRGEKPLAGGKAADEERTEGKSSGSRGSGHIYSHGSSKASLPMIKTALSYLPLATFTLI